MNEIVNKLLLARDIFMPGKQLRQTGFTYSTCVPVTKNKERIWKFKKTDSQYIYQNELDKICFQDNTADGDFNNLPQRQLLINY